MFRKGTKGDGKKMFGTSEWQAEGAGRQRIALSREELAALVMSLQTFISDNERGLAVAGDEPTRRQHEEAIEHATTLLWRIGLATGDWGGSQLPN